MTELLPLSKLEDRQFEKLNWVDPKQVLINLRWLEASLPQQMDERVRRLRTNQLKEWREARAAALFSYGIGKAVLLTNTQVAKIEDRDFDFVMRWSDEKTNYYSPVQLKELPPEDLNPEVSLEGILAKLAKYSGPQNLSVAIQINRRMRFEHRPLASESKPRVLELWYFGCASEDQSRWFLYGSALKENARHYEFEYPMGTPNVA